MTGKPESSALEKFATSCDLQKNIVTKDEIESLHRKNIYEKLAKKLARKMEQNSEEIAVLANYYNVNDADLMMNSKGVAKECNLLNVKEIENCHGKKKGPHFEDKIKFLKKHLQKSKTNFSKDDSLFGILAGKFTADLKGEEKSCPVNDKSGVFVLKSQIYSKSAKEIIETIKNNVRHKENELFENFAQLKLLKDSPDPELLKSFKEYIRKIPENVNEEKYIAKFFTDSNNNKIIAPALESQCKSMNENMKLYLCSDLSELASVDDKISKELFSKLNTEEPLDEQYEVDLRDPSVLTAYGLQCLAKEKIKASRFDKSKDAPNTDNWYKKFTANIRKFETSSAEAASTVGVFCEMYECNNKKAKEVQSCKNGGPITSEDLSNLFLCKSNGVDCDDLILKSITLLQSLEKMKTSPDNSTSGNLANSTSNENGRNSTNRLSSFAENYLGIEGSLRALGKPVTPEIIAEKTKEHEEKIRTMEDSRLAAKDEATSPIPTIKPKEQTVSDSREDAYSVAEAQNEFRANRSGGNNFNSAIRTAPTKDEETKRSPFVAKNENSDNLKEAQRMREEMEKLIAGMKGAGQDSSDLETQLEEMKSATNKKLALGSSSGTNKAEEERLRRWDQTLKDRSRDLDQYRRELDERRYYNESGSARDESGRVPTAKAAGVAQDADKNDRDASGSSSATGGAGGIKLTGSSQSGKVEQKAETAAIIQSGKESSTMTTDELTRLSPENLEKLGIDASRPFTLRVNFNNKTYDIPVKNFSYKGSTILGPIVDKKNKELNGFLLKSPLFKKYYDYQSETLRNR